MYYRIEKHENAYFYKQMKENLFLQKHFMLNYNAKRIIGTGNYNLIGIIMYLYIITIIITIYINCKTFSCIFSEQYYWL